MCPLPARTLSLQPRLIQYKKRDINSQLPSRTLSFCSPVYDNVAISSFISQPHLHPSPATSKVERFAPVRQAIPYSVQHNAKGRSHFTSLTVAEGSGHRRHSHSYSWKSQIFLATNHFGPKTNTHPPASTSTPAPPRHSTAQHLQRRAQPHRLVGGCHIADRDHIYPELYPVSRSYHNSLYTVLASAKVFFIRLCRPPPAAPLCTSSGPTCPSAPFADQRSNKFSSRHWPFCPSE